VGHPRGRGQVREQPREDPSRSLTRSGSPSCPDLPGLDRLHEGGVVGFGLVRPIWRARAGRGYPRSSRKGPPVPGTSPRTLEPSSFDNMRETWTQPL
jgi:hypothetical protein